jgi:NDP-sugar pyrophosphorylase family protein
MSSSRPEAAPLADIDVAVLAGGLGTRLRPVLGEETPKILAPVSGRPFLDHLLGWLAGFGARRVVLCLGFRAQPVLEHLAAHPFPGLDVAASIEPEPLGTAGALRLAAPRLRSDPVLVMNGDTFVDADLAAFASAHQARQAAASILCATVPSTARYGRLDIDDAGRIRGFREKDPADAAPGPINAGLYLFSQPWLQNFARGTAASLERDVFATAPAGTFAAIPATGVTFLDIGTPESFAEAEHVIARALGRRSAASPVPPRATRSVA